MATPTADSYSVPVGQTVYAGRAAPAVVGALTLDGPATGATGVAASGTVQNTGALSQNWTLAVSAGAVVSPTSGTTAAGTSTDFTVTSSADGSYTVTLTNTSGGTVAGSPDTYVSSGLDVTPPSWGSATLSGSSITTSGYTLSASADATDAYGVTGYRYRINAGAWVTGAVRTFSVSGRTAGATDTCQMQARDAAGNWSASISASITLAAAAVVVAASGGDAAFTLSSSAGVTNAPFTVGMALREGQFLGDILVSGPLAAEVDVRNVWGDGSAKFVVISGRVTLAAAASRRCTLQSGTASAGTALAESAITTAGFEAELQFAGGPVMALLPLVGVAAVSDATGLVTGGMVRQLASGAEMSSWLYAARLSATNAHVIGWMEVRVYATGAVHVLPWVENGFTRVSGCAGRAGLLTFALAGTTRFSQADVHLANHCRVVAQAASGCGHWSGTATDLYAAPDPMYMQSTKLVPPYFPDTTGASQLDSLTQTYSPTVYGQLVSSPRDGGGNGTQNGDFDAGMANAGYHAGIGLLPAWDAFYLTSGDRRAWRSVVANAMGYGRYGVHFRDELTLAPFRPADGINKTLPQGSNHNIADVGANQYGGAETLPTVGAYDAGGGTYLKPEYWAQTHHPSAGFMAYLLTGHEFFLELSQFVAGTCFLRQNNVQRSYGLGYQKTQEETVRGQAWALRSIFQAACISRDGSNLQTSFSYIAAQNITFYNYHYISGPLGLCGAFGTPRNTTNFRPDTDTFRVNAFEYDFNAAVWGYGCDLKPVSGATYTNMVTYAKWCAKWPVARLGPLGDAATFGFNCAARNNFIAIAPGPGGTQWDTNTGWYINPGQMFAATPGGSNATNTTNTIGAYVGDDASAGYFPDATSYWGNIQLALCYAVELEVTGARDAYDRMVGASNWSLFESSANGNPGYAHRPRNVFQWGSGSSLGSMSGDTWTPGKDSQGRVNKASWAAVPTGRWISVAGTRIDSQLTTAIQNISAGWNSETLWGTTGANSLFQSWSCFGVDGSRDRLWFFGGGHSDGYNNGLYRFDCHRMQWAIECPPTARSAMSVAYLTNGSATYHPVSTAAAVANFNANNAPGTVIGVTVPLINGPFFDVIPEDGKPTARHSYDAIVFVPTVGASGSVFLHQRRLWRFDLASGAWVYARLFNDQIKGNPPAPGAGAVDVAHAAEASLAIWDEATGKILCSASGSSGSGSAAFNVNTLSWSGWGASYGLNYNHAAHARYGRIQVAFTPPYSDGSTYVGRYWRYNLDTGVRTESNVQLSGISRSAFVTSDTYYDGEAMVYVPPLNRYWVCTRAAAGGMLWTQLDPTTTPWTLSPLTFANNPQVYEKGIIGRLRWLPNMNAVLVWDHCFTNASIYKF